jgi:hypothetical protein
VVEAVLVVLEQGKMELAVAVLAKVLLRMKELAVAVEWEEDQQRDLAQHQERDR